MYNSTTNNHTQIKEVQKSVALQHIATTTALSVPQFPHETWLHILRYLDFRSLARFGQTCKSWEPISLDAFLWKSLCISNHVNVAEIEAAAAVASIHKNLDEIIIKDDLDILLELQDADCSNGSNEKDDSLSLSMLLLLEERDTKTLGDCAIESNMSSAITLQVDPTIQECDEGTEKERINWKFHFSVHRKKVLEKMRKSRAYWAEYQNLERLAKVTSIDEKAEKMRRMMSLQWPLPVIPCFQCESERASAVAVGIRCASVSRMSGIISTDSDGEHSNDSLSSDETDHNNDNDDINNHHINSPNFKTISIPSSSTSYPPFHFRHASAKPTSAGGSATFRFNGNSSTTSSPSRSFIKLPTSISRASTLNNIGHSPGSASLSASPRSSFIHHTLTSGCDLGKKLKDHTPRETVIQALLSLESAPAAATNGASAATNSSNSSNSSVVGGAGEDAIQFLRQVSSIGGSGSGIVAELSNVSQAVAYSNCTISRLLHENGL